jgi:hypothetical protein
MQPPLMQSSPEQKQKIRKRLGLRHFAATGDLEASRAFDRAVCEVLGIDADAHPPTFLTDPHADDLVPA